MGQGRAGGGARGQGKGAGQGGPDRLGEPQKAAFRAQSLLGLGPGGGGRSHYLVIGIAVAVRVLPSAQPSVSPGAACRVPQEFISSLAGVAKVEGPLNFKSATYTIMLAPAK